MVEDTGGASSGAVLLGLLVLLVLPALPVEEVPALIPVEEGPFLLFPGVFSTAAFAVAPLRPADDWLLLEDLGSLFSAIGLAVLGSSTISVSLFMSAPTTPALVLSILSLLVLWPSIVLFLLVSSPIAGLISVAVAGFRSSSEPKEWKASELSAEIGMVDQNPKR